MHTAIAYLFLSIILSLAMALAISRILYPWPWQNSRLRQITAWVLFILRFFALFLLLLLLFNPGIKEIQVESNKPVLAVLKDNSQSMSYLNDSSGLVNIDSLWQKANMQLSEIYDIRDFTFAQNLQQNKPWNFSGKATDLGYALKQIPQSINDPVAALVLISDGNYNQGENPVFVSRNLPFPIFSIGIGDTLARTEIYVHQIYNNPISYLNELTPIEVDIRSNRTNQDTVIQIHIKKNDNIVATKQVTFKKDRKRHKFKLYIKPEETGLQKYNLKLGENSGRTFYLKVKKQRQKVLLLYHAVHPDIGLIRKALEHSNRFKPVLKQASKFNGKLSDYNMVVLHQVPSGNFVEDRWFAEVVDKKIPYWLILGPQSDFSTFNQGQNALLLSELNGDFEEASARLNERFSVFQVDPVLQRNIAFLPPLNVPFGNYNLKRGNELFKQNLHGVETDRPAWFYTDQPYRISVLAGTGIWKWGMYLYRQTASHQSLDDLIYKTVKFLSLNEPRKRLIIDNENLYNATQPIEIEATWYNENYEPDNSLPGFIEINDTANNTFKYTFMPSGNRYKARPGVLPSGEYHFRAIIEGNNKIYADTGSFMVGQNNIELSSMTLNKQLLQKMSGKDRFYRANDLQSLVSLLTNEMPVKRIRKTEIRVSDLIEKNILLWIIVLFLTIEWIIRKFKGQV